METITPNTEDIKSAIKALLIAIGENPDRDGLKGTPDRIVRMWKECGLHVENAAQSQALIQLKRRYCERKDCLRCRIGYEYLRRKN